MEREQLLAFMREKAYKPLTAAELVAALEIEDIKSFLELLNELEQEGAIVLTKKHKYGLTEKMGLLSGRIQGHPKGFGFFIPDLANHPDVFINPEDLNGALHHDRVIVRLNKAAEGGSGLKEK